MFHVRRSDENIYSAGLKRLFSNVIAEVRETGKLNGPAMRRFMQSSSFSSYLENLIKKMIGSVRRTTAMSWSERLQRKKRGREMAKLVKNEMKGTVGERVMELIAENAAYIKTLPDEWALYATQYAYRESLNGKRPDQIEAELRKIMPPHITKNLKTIARTECAKANAAIAQARAEMCGINAYIWHSMADERTRAGHRRMNGVLVFYNDAPSPEELVGEKSYGHYHAGNIFNCRCYQEPVVDWSFLPDSVEVYEQGEIKFVSRNKLKDRLS